jgi:hypothetical protein
MSSVGGIEAHLLEWKKGVPFVHSSRWRQTGRPGNGHTVGKSYSDASKITTTHFLNSKSDEEAFLKTCAALCGAPQTVVESTQQLVDVTTEYVWFESVTVTKANGAVGVGSTTYMVVLDWMVYIPHDW